jgi:hypothetical protein
LFYPLADVGWAILELDPLRFAGCEKLYGVPVHQTHFLEIKQDSFGVWLGVKEPLEFSDVTFPDPAAESEGHLVTVLGPFNLQHRDGILSNRITVSKILKMIGLLDTID